MPGHGPKRFTVTALKHFGVTLVDAEKWILNCDVCGQGWQVPYPKGERTRARGWWICPHGGCNDPHRPKAH